MERSKQIKHVVCNKDNNGDNGVDSGDHDSVDNGDDGVDDGDDSDDKHLTHLSQAADYCLMEKKKQNKHVDCIKDNDGDKDVDNDGDNDDDDSVNYGIDIVDDGADKYLTHLSQAAECCLMERSKQSKHVVGSEDNDIDSVDDDSVENGDGNGVEDDNDVNNDVDNGDEDSVGGAYGLRLESCDESG
eukprot:9702005-Ditylum_brightwellii.AAC.2